MQSTTNGGKILDKSFSVVDNQEERSKSVHFQRQKKIKGYADFCCEKYMELL
jgi:very-short-patch-repair endonuclease